jgi:hypothetical protein
VLHKVAQSINKKIWMGRYRIDYCLVHRCIPVKTEH